MKHRIALACAAMLLVAAALAQNTSTGGTSQPPAMKPGVQGHAHHGAGAATGALLTGCLNGPNAENAYLLTSKANRRGIEVGMPGSDELSKHVGHRVKLTGTWVKSDADIGESGESEAGEREERSERGEKHFRVTAIQHLAESCTLGGSGKTGAKASARGNEKEGAITNAITDDKVKKRDREKQKVETGSETPR